MRLEMWTWLLLGFLTLAATGCYHTVEGRTKSGVPFAKDRFSSRYERSLEQCRTAALRVLKYNGELIRDDRVANTMVAKIKGRTVYVKLFEEEPNLTKVTVQARNENGTPATDLAAEIKTQIALQLPR